MLRLSRFLFNTGKLQCYTATGKPDKITKIVGFFPDHKDLTFEYEIAPTWKKGNDSGILFNPEKSLTDNLKNPDKDNTDQQLLTINYATSELLALGLAMEAVKSNPDFHAYNFFCTNEYARNVLSYLHRFWARNNWIGSTGDPVKHKDLIQILVALEAELPGEAEFIHFSNAKDDWRQMAAYNVAWNKNKYTTPNAVFYSKYAVQILEAEDPEFPRDIKSAKELKKYLYSYSLMEGTVDTCVRDFKLLGFNEDVEISATSAPITTETPDDDAVFKPEKDEKIKKSSGENNVYSL